jgi:hypothetical protein
MFGVAIIEVFLTVHGHFLLRCWFFNFLNAAMSREKLFFSTIYMILALAASLASVPLLLVLIANERTVTLVWLAILLGLPVVSIGLLWRCQFSSSFALRRNSFLAWGFILSALGLANTALPASVQTIYGNLTILGIALIAMSFYVRRKELARLARDQQASATANDSK